MLRNVSYNYKTVREELEGYVGKSYPVWQRIKFGGVGSRRMVIHDCSSAIKDLLAKDKYINYCNIEIRPKGIVVYFRARLEMYALAIHFAVLDFVRENRGLNIKSDHYYVILQPFNRDKLDTSFVSKVFRFQDQYLGRV